MKKNLIIFLLILILVIIIIAIIILFNDKEIINKEFICEVNNDCVSTCGMGCVNKNWAENYKDPCVNIRAFDCSCQNNVCFTDNNPPKIE